MPRTGGLLKGRSPPQRKPPESAIALLVPLNKYPVPSPVSLKLVQ
ncbi:hypothetical protein [Laspinema palackyanum]